MGVRYLCPPLRSTEVSELTIQSLPPKRRRNDSTCTADGLGNKPPPPSRTTPAKSYKRPTKKEKLGISASKNAPSKPIQRNAAISSTMSKPEVPNRPAAGFEGKSAIEQRAAKLILEAEKRAAARSGREGNAGAEDGHDDDEEDGDVDMDAHSFMAARAAAAAAGGKKKTGASGMKAKAAKRKSAGGEEEDGTKPKYDYVDLL